ncbi:hypothetical protein AMTR_s00044p00084580 [Amborella trichopoda]|uniref:Uncharacterized protein n=1 Tax=Amborella trichopoda TaxID=13333 RepID=U5CUV8_AMBTC|nr:hypothetical protein AMTR_s00044p00084580 [Amborella trichopoda]
MRLMEVLVPVHKLIELTEGIHCGIDSLPNSLSSNHIENLMRWPGGLYAGHGAGKALEQLTHGVQDGGLGQRRKGISIGQRAKGDWEQRGIGLKTIRSINQLYFLIGGGDTVY